MMNIIWVKIINQLFPCGYIKSPYLEETNTIKKVKMESFNVPEEKILYTRIYKMKLSLDLENKYELKFQFDSTHKVPSWVISFRSK